MSKALTLPAPVQRSIEDFAAGFLMPEGAPTFDFTRPGGEPALVPADSVSWRIFKNPVTMFIGGVAAVLLELAEPRVRHGVWDHSNFRTEPLKRLQRTGLAAMVTIYGPGSASRAMIAGVNAMHARVSGTTSGGIPYRADEPRLLDWVQATAAFGFLEAYCCYARTLGTAERDLYYSEAVPVAALYGATGAPASQAEALALLRRMRPKLEPSATLFEFLAIMREMPALPAAGRPAQAMLVRAAVAILPHGIAELLRIGPEWRLRSWERPLVRTLARSADRLLLRSSPAVQSCLRLGLAENHLYT
ncbi:oxygenase MpaB family protein [Allosphingosinicella sp.]|uniref:oxygenase MpaB family protein n=1 Tax=Allosphingosinicella sp. TaxID=2823234 RepID=UPI002EEAE353